MSFAAAENPASGPVAGGPRLSPADRRAFQQLIYQETGITLTDAKHELIASRLSGRLRQLRLPSYQAYLDLLKGSDAEGGELREMIDRITTNKTSFFRESHHFRWLRERLLAGARPRIWSAACSTGEEPVSIAITASETCGGGRIPLILATDISTRVLQQAQSGIYQSDRMEGIPPATLRRHFLRGRGSRAGSYCVRQELRGQVDFRRLNLMREWDGVGRFDIVFCRNALIYFNRSDQEKLARRFARVLLPGGYLVLGHSENLAWLSDLFEPVGQTIYRLRTSGGRTAVQSPASSHGTARPALADVRIIVGQVASSRTPQVVSTVLGSCVSACLYDPVSKVGGMNHFMLPDGDCVNQPSRYGVHAMELLINEIMQLGGDRRRLQAKVFGGATSPSLGLSINRVAERNAQFVRDFLKAEGIPLVSERLGGELPLEVRMETATGRVLTRTLDPGRFGEDAPAPIPVTRPAGDVTLF